MKYREEKYGESKGTKHMIDIAMKKGMFIKVVKY